MLSVRLLATKFGDVLYGSEWRTLRDSLDQIEADWLHTALPRPTKRMVRYLIVAEDRRFAKHAGFDIRALVRAGWSTWWRKIPQGGSTVAMQLVRTLTGNSEKTLMRKLQEIYLAVLLSRYVPRSRVPMLYLWCAYYGWRMTNFSQACRRLGVRPGAMSLAAEAELVARLKYPEPRNISPSRRKQISERGLHILRLAETPGWTPSFETEDDRV